MRPRACSIAALLLLAAAAPSCAAILGDDFKIDDDGQSSSQSDGCASKPDCITCLQCSCPNEYNACVVGTPCNDVLQCADNCADGDDVCVNDCYAQPGAEEADAFTACGCQPGADCAELCCVAPG